MFFIRGGSRNFRKGGRKPNSRKGGPEYRLFSAAFSHFLINLLQIFQQKGGAAARPAPRLNPRLFITLITILSIFLKYS